MAQTNWHSEESPTIYLTLRLKIELQQQAHRLAGFAAGSTWPYESAADDDERQWHTWQFPNTQTIKHTFYSRSTNALLERSLLHLRPVSWLFEVKHVQTHPTTIRITEALPRLAPFHKLAQCISWMLASRNIAFTWRHVQLPQRGHKMEIKRSSQQPSMGDSTTKAEAPGNILASIAANHQQGKIKKKFRERKCE